jgi:hypothetical protein
MKNLRGQSGYYEGFFKPLSLDLDPGLTLGYQFLKHQSVTLGFGMLPPATVHEVMGFGWAINNEYTFKNDKGDGVYSPQLSVFYNLMAAYLGVNTIYSTNFKDGGVFAISPEVGIGALFIFCTYSRNFILIDNEDIPINKNNLSVKLLIPLSY